MRLPNDASKFSAKFRFMEFGKYVEKAFGKPDGTFKPGVIRDNEKLKAAVLYTWEEIAERVKRYQNTGVYTSIFQYDGRIAEKAQSLSGLYFDLDSKDPSVAHQEAQRLYQYLREVISEEAIRIYFTGQKGYHIELEALALGVGPSADLADTFRYIAGDLRTKLELTTVDFQVYDPRRMWRIPNSRHQLTGLFKVPLHAEELAGPTEAILLLAEAPRWDLEVPEQTFDSKANEWYREYIYLKAKPTLSQEEMIDRFARHGTGMIRERGEVVFDPVSLFQGCPAILRLWDKAEKEHHLEHEERLFLCSILSYSDQAVDYLHEILKNCTDYNPSITQAHVDDWIRRREHGIGGRPYSCQRANSAGVGCGDCNLEPKERWQTVGDRMVPTGEFSAPSPIRYAYRRKEPT